MRLLLLFLALVFVGCGAQKPDFTNPLQDRGELLGTSLKERPIRALTLGTGPEVVLIMATIHGNENAGTPLTMELIRHIESKPEILTGRKVIFLPVTNPDGYRYNTRHNARMVDLNRNFDAPNRRERRTSGAEPLSEPESRIVRDLIEREKPSRIVSMHEPLELIDWDGPGEPLARHMARFTNLKAERLGSRPGSLGSWAGETLGIPIITLEFPEGAGDRPAAELWQDYGQCLVAAITFPNDPPTAE